MLSLFFEKWKVKSKCFEIEIEKWKFSRILNHSREARFLTDLFRESQIRLLKQMACSWGNNHEHVHNLTILKSESLLTNLLYCRPINLLNLNISWKQRKWKYFWDNLWLRSIRPQYFVVTIQRGVSSAELFLLLLSSARMGGTAAYDQFYFEITYLSYLSPIITLPSLSLSSKLDWCGSGMQKCQLKTCWCCCSCQRCYWWGTY